MNLIFDLDGTLVDARERLYVLFERLVPNSNLSYESYWRLKRQKISNQEILIKYFGHSAESVEKFLADWMRNIESPELLGLDRCFPGIHEALENFGSRAHLHLCTARQNKHRAIEQLEHLGLLPYFKNVMLTEQKLSKQDCISRIAGLGPADWVIGDTGKDIQAGRELGLHTCGVLSGFLNAESLKLYSPDVILNYASEFRLKP